MSSEDRDISRIFSQKVERRFQRDFGRFIGGSHSNRFTSTPNELKRITESAENSLNVKLIEAKEEVDSLRRKLNARNEEIERLKSVENTSKAKIEELNIQLNELKLEIEKGKRKSFDCNEDKSKEKLLLSDYRNALSKYKTWMEFADKQLNEMKVILEEIGGWTEANRYRIYFAYRGIAPEMISDDSVASLSNGSIINYPGNIENIEGITASEYRPRFYCVSTQTEGTSVSSEENRFAKPLLPSHLSSDGMSANELRLLDCERQIEQLEIQNAQMREQLIIFGDRAKHVELLEEQKEDLKLQLSILVRQNQKLLEEQEQFKSAFSGGEEQLKLKNEQLTKRLKTLEDQREGLGLAESRRIAKIFKQKYEKEMAQLRSKLEEYEKSSDTTRICRFVQCNPLDEAHDDHFVKKVAAEATAAAKFGVNTLKRRKMEDDIDSSQPANNSDLTFLVEDEDEEDPSTIRELRLQLANVKTLVEQNEQSNSEYLAQYKEFVKLLCGYDIRFGEDGFCEAENILSKDCTFLFQKQQIPLDGEGSSSATGAGIDLLDSESARQWKDVLENYLLRYQSIPAFLSAVTIALVESPETPVSSSRQSSIEEITSSHNSTIENEE